MAWQPLQPEHAIERVRIIVVLDGQMPAKFLRVLAARNEQRRLDLEFTSKNLRRGTQFTLNPGGVSLDGAPTELLGWDWQRISPANAPIETFVVENQVVVYETAEYTRWEKFLKRYQEVATPVLEAVQNIVDVQTVSLEYVDRFVFEGAPEDAAPDFLLDKVVSLLPSDAASGETIWHVHRGWFEKLNGRKLLINQNLEAQDGVRPGKEKVRSLQVFTKTELQIGNTSLGIDTLALQLNGLHDRSKALFTSVLSEDMQDRVGLIGGTDA